MYQPSSRGGGPTASAAFGGGSFVPKRYAITTNPPTLVLEYGDNTLGLLRTRKFRLKKIASSEGLESTADEIIRRFPSKISRSLVSRSQLLRLLGQLKDKVKTGNEALRVDEDLNKYTTEELDAMKDRMNEKFMENAKRPGDEGYVYDKQVDFGQPTEDNDWDSTDEEDEDEDLPLP
ncbi:putative centrosomal protein [Chloropicon primus]|uniref:Centrosomal protein of 19 kDa n=1 Tax=Chloropicon primus TaxID=1764295 RepID=A0A5B8MXK8_9CHLO|nr:putative centrosomal protein [Chloropicon primus]UPR03412.1 putative centrosomal protein [Chloropicon primus]|eukprot:QDZ24204.1 putative centrosomal protein [Chloropicon primus]